MGVKSISLSTRKAVYYEGDVVEGICTVEIAPGQSTDGGIILKFKGHVKTHWTHRRTKSWVEEHTAKVCFFDSQIFLTTEQGLLQSGYHRLPFSFKLPSPTSSSFEGAFGYIRYWIEAEVPTQWIFGRNEKLPVRVLQLIDTNLLQYRFPVTGKDYQGENCCWCCASGPLYIEANTDRAAYCPNDIICITANFHNDSAKRQARPYAKLVQKIVFHDSEGYTRDVKNEWKLETAGNTVDGTQDYITEGGSASWNGMQFKLPEVIPCVDCKIIQIYYEIELGLGVKWAFDLAVYLPIVIATIPFCGDEAAHLYEPMPHGYGGGNGSAVKKWSGSGKGLRRHSSTPHLAPPLLPPINFANHNYEVPHYFGQVLHRQVPKLDTKDHGHDNRNDNKGQHVVCDQVSPTIPDPIHYYEDIGEPYFDIEDQQWEDYSTVV